MGNRIHMTESELKGIIMEAVMKAVTNESALDREFHYILLTYLNKMIETNEIHLSQAEQEMNGGKNFLSLTRNRSNQQGFQYGQYTTPDHYSHQDNYARIEFDGRALNNVRNAKIGPYDYLSHENSWDTENMNGKQLHQSEFDNNDWANYNDDDPYSIKRQFYSQAEDRLMTDAESIPNALKYITRIDVMVRDENKKDYQQFLDLISNNPEWKEKTRIHRNDKEFNRPVNEANQTQNNQRGKLRRVRALNRQLWAVKKEADALGLQKVSKWIYLAIESINTEFLTDTIKNGWNRAKDTVQGIFKEGDEN